MPKRISKNKKSLELRLLELLTKIKELKSFKKYPIIWEDKTKNMK